MMEDLTVTENGEFAFPTALLMHIADSGSRYEVVVSRQPVGQKCVVNGGSGEVKQHTFSVQVTCSSAKVSTFAGSGLPGTDDSNGRFASFNSPSAVAFAGNGDLMVADLGSGLVRKISRTGNVSRVLDTKKRPSALAVGASGGYVGGAGYDGFIREVTQAGRSDDLSRFVANAMAMDANGDLYFINNQGLYKYSSGRVSILTLTGWGDFSAGLQPNQSVTFSDAEGIAVDATGNVYIAETGAHRIRKITSWGGISTLAGSGVKGAIDNVGDKAAFNYPSGLALDGEGNIFVADTQNHVVRKITPAGMVSTIAGRMEMPGSEDGVGGDAKFLRPRAVAIGADGVLFVADTGNHLIRMVTLN